MPRPRVLERRVVTTYKTFDGWRIPVDEVKTIGHLPKKWLTPEETESIIRVAENHSKMEACALRLYSYGLRRGEVVGSATLPGIRRRDVNTLKGTIWVRGKGDPRSVVKDRELAFPDEVMRTLSTLVLDTPLPDDKVFRISDDTIWLHLKQYAQEAGLKDWQKVHPHRLRAFFANDAKWRRGLDDFDVQQLMRHKSPVQTQQYTGPAPPDFQAKKMREISQSRLNDQET